MSETGNSGNGAKGRCLNTDRWKLRARAIPEAQSQRNSTERVSYQKGILTPGPPTATPLDYDGGTRNDWL
jgi:hypothetical protein